MNERFFFNTLVLLILLWGYEAFSQTPNNTLLGLRINEGIGVTIKHTLKEDQSMEGILYYRWHGVTLTGLYQLNYPVFNDPAFRFYLGAGTHIGFWNGFYNPESVKYKSAVYMIAGIDGQSGLEYSFKSIPLNLSVDWKPAFNIYEESRFWIYDFAFSIRYILK